ncbi:hypothetical protein [Streptomyces sp. NPDC058955]
MDAIAESLNSLRADATRRITKGRVFVQLCTRTSAEAIASWLGTRPTR